MQDICDIVTTTENLLSQDTPYLNSLLSPLSLDRSSVSHPPPPFMPIISPPRSASPEFPEVFPDESVLSPNHSYASLNSLSSSSRLPFDRDALSHEPSPNTGGKRGKTQGAN